MKNPLVFVFCFILTFATSSSAQFSPGARQIALMESSLASPTDAFAVFQNPAGISLIPWREIGVYYSPSPFGMSELANAYGAFINPFSFGSIGIGLMSYGFDLYSEKSISVVYSRMLVEKFYAGISSEFNFVKIQNYGNSSAAQINLGALYVIDRDLRIGFYASNILRASYPGTNDQLPVNLSVGLSYDPVKNATIHVAAVKDLDFPISFKAGIEYTVIRYLDLRVGTATEPAAFSGGIGINYSYFQFNYAVLNHPDLGITHQAGIIIHFSKFKSRISAIKENIFK